ncbi:hypothetical protein [Streptomyces sp. Wb2n-11]|uniref:hypothetical protein n=1 Tax=Streptomyces sp. Wb2n-11 TaxID=1030533 RepID=UPI000ACA6934|nr:hypothetical protein [Streptomyces sp. Wb2n-11]
MTYETDAANRAQRQQPPSQQQPQQHPPQPPPPPLTVPGQTARHATTEPGHETGHGPGPGHSPGHETASASAAAAQEPAPHGLLPHGERDKLALRLQQAVNAFVDGPRRSVEEADSVFEEAARCLTEAVAERRGSLRTAWAGRDREAETEELRVALRTYREVTERLLRI